MTGSSFSLHSMCKVDIFHCLLDLLKSLLRTRERHNDWLLQRTAGQICMNTPVEFCCSSTPHRQINIWYLCD